MDISPDEGAWLYKTSINLLAYADDMVLLYKDKGMI